MKRYLWQITVGLLLALAGLAAAQTINRSVQLSQDPSGPIGFDTSNNVYFPQHILSNTPSSPAITCGTTPTLLGTDTTGRVTTGTSAATCVVTFSQAYLQAPNCIFSWEDLSPQIFATSTTAYTITFQSSTTTKHFDYFCTGQK